ncbi:hypothetical protein [Rossellomorea marisflavi]|uniref:hypothetical protein n=1 Tax=Rossellomorea marisflavi TaxID=189381 RepID=UPI00345AD30C
MKQSVQNHFQNLSCPSKQIQYEAYQSIMDIKKKPGDWAYEVWDELVNELSSPDPHARSRAAQFLARLSISDPEKRIIRDFSGIWAVTYDEKFVTARHALQEIWRIGLAGDKQFELVWSHMEERFKNCEGEKNFTLVRADLIQSVKSLSFYRNDDTRSLMVEEWIESIPDEKNRKKYWSIWRRKMT